MWERHLHTGRGPRYHVNMVAEHWLTTDAPRREHGCDPRENAEIDSNRRDPQMSSIRNEHGKMTLKRAREQSGLG